MPEGRISRVITVATSASRIEDGAELRTPRNLPASWQDGDMVVVKLPSGNEATLIAEPEDGEDVFSYKRDSYSTWHIGLERLPPDDRGHLRLRVKFDEHHKYLQQRDDEEGR